MQVIQEKRHAR